MQRPTGENVSAVALLTALSHTGPLNRRVLWARESIRGVLLPWRYPAAPGSRKLVDEMPVQSSITTLEARARHQAHQHVLETAVDNDLLAINVSGTVTR
jgi:hypothetical protein